MDKNNIYLQTDMGVYWNENIERSKIRQGVNDILDKDIFLYYLDDLSQLYLEVFSNPSWNDWEYDTERKYSVSSKTHQVVRTSQQQKEKIIQEISGKNLIHDFLLIEKQISGFIYGWETTLKQLNIDKLNLSNDDFIQLEFILSQQWLVPSDTMVYLSQLWLSEFQRGKWYGKKLIKNFILQAKEQMQSYLILRTSKKRALPYEYILTNHQWQVIHEYDDYASNVIILVRI